MLLDDLYSQKTIMVESRYGKVSIRAFIQRVEKKISMRSWNPADPRTHSPSAVRIGNRIQDFLSILTVFVQFDTLRGNRSMQALLPRGNNRSKEGYILGRESGFPVNQGISLDQLEDYSAHRVLDIDNPAQ